MIVRTLATGLAVVWLLLLGACGQEVSPPSTPAATPAPAATPMSMPMPMTTPATEEHADEHQEEPVTEHEGHGEAALAKMRDTGCLVCHRLNGEGGEVGPSLVGIYGTMRELTTGEKVVANDEYLHESIDDPNAKVVKGFAPNVMPSMEGKLSHEDIEEIIRFLKELQ